MKGWEKTEEYLKDNQHIWLITGVAGFIGCNLLEKLLLLNQKVVGLDNFATGRQANLDDVKKNVGLLWANFNFIEGDLRNIEDVQKACEGAEYILHQGALGSVPRSINNPQLSNEVNVGGTLNVFWAGHENKVKRIVFASSSSVYGDNEDLPKLENNVGHPLSPYAVTKKAKELYARVFAETYDLDIVGLRYFNVFGPRQNTEGPYAAVIPKWTKALLEGENVEIYGDGETSRDFTYIENVLRINILAALSEKDWGPGEIFNSALNDTTSLTNLYYAIRDSLAKIKPEVAEVEPDYQGFRPGDIRHSQANVDKAREKFGYEPAINIQEGLDMAMKWYCENLI